MEQTDKRKVGIVIPTYQKCDDVIQCIEKIKDDPRVETITIVDDHSQDEIYWLLEDSLYNEEEESKIRLGRNTEHIGEELNLHRSIVMSDSQWVLVVKPSVDLTPKILDEVFSLEWDEKKFVMWDNEDIFFDNRNQYLQNSPHTIHLEQQEEEEVPTVKMGTE